MSEENLSEEEKAAEQTPEEVTSVQEEVVAEEVTISEEVETESSSFDDLVAEIDATPTTEESAGEAETGSVAAAILATGDDATETPVKEEKKVDERRWYSLRVISGKERKIKERIELEIERSGWKDHVTNVLVPTEKVYKIRAGKKVISERNILPGYILVQAYPDSFSGEMISAIANVPNVIHFLGRNNPIPMQQSEANRMLGKVDDSSDAGESLIEPFIVGETIKIIDGPFSEFVGDIQEVNEEKKKMKVIVKIFGRGTEVELNFIQVEKQ